MDDFDTTRQQVHEAIRTVLVPEMIERRLDPEPAIEAILGFVLRKEDMPGEETRYEWFYSRRGLAVNIAEGWKANYLPQLKEPTSVTDSIHTYVRNTYGTNYELIG